MRIIFLSLIVVLFLVGCKSAPYDSQKSFFPLFERGYKLGCTELWLVVFKEKRKTHSPLFQEEMPCFLLKDNVKNIYKLDSHEKQKFVNITKCEGNFLDGADYILGEYFAFIFVQDREVVQIVVPNLDGGNFGDYPPIPKRNDCFFGWSLKGIEKLKEFVKGIELTNKSLCRDFPYESYIIEKYK
jgi:hypothetical protein